MPAVLRDQQGLVQPETAVAFADVVQGAGFQPGGPDGIEDEAGLQRHVDQALQLVAKRPVQEACREQHYGFVRLHRSQGTDVPPQNIQQAPGAGLIEGQVLGRQGAHIGFNDLLGRIKAG